MKQKVLVTTEYRGVYVGDLKEHDKAGRSCVLTNARMCIHWGTDKGVDQLADDGPMHGGKYASKAREIWIPGLTSLVVCSDAAALAWDNYND